MVWHTIKIYETEPELQPMYPSEIAGEQLRIVDVVLTMTWGLNQINEAAG